MKAQIAKAKKLKSKADFSTLIGDDITLVPPSTKSIHLTMVKDWVYGHTTPEIDSFVPGVADLILAYEMEAIGDTQKAYNIVKSIPLMNLPASLIVTLLKTDYYVKWGVVNWYLYGACQPTEFFKFTTADREKMLKGTFTYAPPSPF